MSFNVDNRKYAKANILEVMSGTSNLAVAELVIFSFVLLSSLIYIVRHGIRGSAKWPSITLLALIHVIGSAYQIKADGNANDAVEIMDSVGLFLILLAFSGELEPLTLKFHVWICSLVQLLLLLAAIIVIIGFTIADLGFGSIELQCGLVAFALILMVEVSLVGVAFIRIHQFNITKERRASGGHSLIVTEASEMDNSTIALSMNNMDNLRISYGDIVLVGPKRRKETVLIATPREDVDDRSAQMNYVVRRNLNIKLGDSITVRPYTDIKRAKRVAVLPISDTLRGFTGSVFEKFLVPYFYEAYRPLRQGDHFTVDEDMMHVEFEVVEIDPPDYGIVAQNTDIHFIEKPFVESLYNDVATCGTMRSRVNHAVLSIPFIVVRLVYSLINGFDKQLLGSSTVFPIARAVMAILMEVLILTLFYLTDLCGPHWYDLKDEALVTEEGKSSEL